MSNDRLIYLPLGGAGEIGMNCYLYGYGPAGKERFIMVDLGLTFPDMDTTPGVDLILPDIEWIEKRRDRLDAIFITHAHEDHVGAVGHLWGHLKAPIYARSFTAHMARLKFEEAGHDELMIKTAPVFPDMIEAGAFKVGFAPISHSIPESSALVIDTPAGRIVHTGDFKLDANPGVGEAWDPALWSKIAKPGVKALVCDSTNVFSPLPGRSEVHLARTDHRTCRRRQGPCRRHDLCLEHRAGENPCRGGQEGGPLGCASGPRDAQMITAGVETGILADFPATVSPEDALSIPRESLMLIVTGSQGERRAASAQLSRGKYLGLTLKEGDLFLFSSKTIPGNERSVGRIVNAFSEMGVDVVDDSSGIYHVSGHANRPDLAEMHRLIAPDVVIPMHGEHRHLREHVKLAAENGLTGVLAPNGSMVEISGKAPKVVEHIQTGRTYLDGAVLIGAMDGVVRDRIRMALNGHVLVTLIVEDNQPLGEAWCEIMGLPETGRSRAPLVEVLEEDVTQFLMRAGRKTLVNDDKLGDEIKSIVRKTANDEIGKKPEVTVVVSRLQG